MDKEDNNSEPDRLDAAISRRLAKLRAVPVDTSNLERRLEAVVGRPHRRIGWQMSWFRPMRAIAASFLVMGLIAALVITSSSGPVFASAATMARVHEEVVSGHMHTTPVASIQAANTVLAAKLPGGPRMPDMPQQDQVMSCCIHEVGRKKMACVTMLVDGIRVTVAVADATDVKMPMCPAVKIGGVDYHTQSHGGVSMAMTERNGRWVCVMGKLPVARLAEVAATMRF